MHHHRAPVRAMRPVIGVGIADVERDNRPELGFIIAGVNRIKPSGDCVAFMRLGPELARPAADRRTSSTGTYWPSPRIFQNFELESFL